MSDIISNATRVVDTASDQSQVPRIAVASARSTDTQPNVLRTVYLPNEQVGKIKSENDNLNY